MISASTFGFALALVVVVNAAVVSIIWSRLTQAQASLRDTMTNSLQQHSATLERIEPTLKNAMRAAPANLAAEVAALTDAVAKLRTTQLKFQGRFDQYVGQRAMPVNGAGTQLASVGVDDPEFAAELALQLAPPASPGGGR